MSLSFNMIGLICARTSPS